MIAEGFGDARFERGLIVLYHKQVVAIPVTNVLAYLALREDRVTGDDRPVEWQLFQQDQGRGDFVLVRLDNQIADHRTQVCREGRQHMDGLVGAMARSW